MDTRGIIGEAINDELKQHASGLDGRLLRPLSAGHLPPTLAEEHGPVERGRLGCIHGRSRREQFAMARRFGILAAPGPGDPCCLLAEPYFARRLRDLLAHREGPLQVGPGLPERPFFEIQETERVDAVLNLLASLGTLHSSKGGPCTFAAEGYVAS